RIDGASEFYMFRKFVLPLSLPFIAVMALFDGVSLSNQHFGALVYVFERKMYRLQLRVRDIIVVNEISTDVDDGAGATASLVEQVKAASLLKYAVIIVSSMSLLILYPFLQKFFVKGVLIGSVKE